MGRIVGLQIKEKKIPKKPTAPKKEKTDGEKSE